MKLVILAAGWGSRLWSEAGRSPKMFLEIGGRTLLERQLDIAAFIGLEPLVVTRPELAAEFRRTGVEVLVEESPTGILATLYHARAALDRPFCWMGGDMLFTDPAPLAALVADHLAGNFTVSFFFRQSTRFKAKLVPGPPVEVVVTWEPGYSLSIPNFWVLSPEVLAHMAPDPNANYMRGVIAAGQPFLFREYPAPVFEIDTPEEVAAARRFFEEGTGEA
jgi:CTP:molybdopterin cytidylyltransferase MocA